MRILKFVPSKNRAEIFKKHTASWLNPDEDTKLFIEPQDREQYSFVPEENIVVLPENDKGLGYSLYNVKQYAVEHGYDAIWKIDDDIGKFRKRKQKQPENPAERILQKQSNFDEIEKVATQILRNKKQVGAIGFPYDNEMYEAKDYSINQKLQTSYIVRTELFDPRPEISTQEDYWAYIHVRMQGYAVVRFGNYGISLGVEVGGGTGGLQDFDRKQLITGEMEYIRNIYPNIVFKAKPNSKWGYEVDFVKSKLERK